MSLYADDAAVFINLIAHDLQATKFILQLFADASCLTTNIPKTEFYLIQCRHAANSWCKSNHFVIPHFEKEEMKSSYVYLVCSNHTYSNNMITRFNVQ
jgi:hypothetical protein